MKRVFVISFFLVSFLSLFADAKVDKTISDFALFFQKNKESIASISHGITSNSIYNYVDGDVVKIIHKSDYNGFFNDGLVMKCTPTYYFHNKQYINEYYIFISNIILNPEIKEGSPIKKFETLIGKSSLENVPYNGGTDTKYVVFTYEKNNKHLIALSGGHPGASLPGINNVFIFPGTWLCGDVHSDHLIFEALRNNKDIIPLLQTIEDNDASYGLDIAHTISIKLEKFDKIKNVKDNSDLNTAIQSFQKMFHGLPFDDMKKYVECTIDGHSFYIVVTDSMTEYYINEVTSDPPVLYLRSIGGFKKGTEMKPVLYLVDFQPFFYEDKVEAVISAYSKE